MKQSMKRDMKCQEKKVKFWFLFLLFFCLHCMACGILVPWPGIEPGPSAVRLWSPNPWTAREFPKVKLWMGWSVTEGPTEMTVEQRPQGSEEAGLGSFRRGASGAVERGADGAFLVHLKTGDDVLPFLRSEVVGRGVLYEDSCLENHGSIFFLGCVKCDFCF